jgi:poly(U)-specific endoribonuclease
VSGSPVFDLAWPLFLQGKKPYWKEDKAEDPLFDYLDQSVLRRPTYAAFVSLLDNYSAETGVDEVVTHTERAEVKRFLRAILETPPMQFCHRYCHEQKPDLVPADRDGFLQVLQKIWFDLYRRDGARDSSGFEHVFVGEIKEGKISGFHNWIQLYSKSKEGRALFVV